MHRGRHGVRAALSLDRILAIDHCIRGMTSELTGNAILLEEGALAAHHLRRIIGRRDECQRRLRQVIEDDVEAGLFVPCDTRLVAFAIPGAVGWIPKGYGASGPPSGSLPRRERQEVAP